ncbi:LOW QUALITY PROTEIN: hypothetical protein V1478_000951 [Vespula squamosa]|uniref:Uncharacterized protein n=1 Tax=Vespula squamosa TaxID=30214 RepID=A0ABD2C706_VESSQ
MKGVNLKKKVLQYNFNALNIIMFKLLKEIIIFHNSHTSSNSYDYYLLSYSHYHHIWHRSTGLLKILSIK